MTIAYCDTVLDMWNDLRKQYETVNTPKIHQLKANITNCKQGDMDIGEFYSKLVNLWIELSDLVKVPVCTCKGCTCGVASKLVTMHENDKAHQFLMGLNDGAYSTIRSQILAIDPLPSLDRIFNITQQEENHKQIVVNRDQRGESAMAFAIKEQPKMEEKGACRICGRYGHEESVCC